MAQFWAYDPSSDGPATTQVDASGKSWQDIAKAGFGANAQGVIDGLNKVNPSLDWSKYVVDQINAEHAWDDGSLGYVDPNRSTYAAPLAEILKASGTAPKFAEQLEQQRQQFDSGTASREAAASGGGGLFGGFGGLLLAAGIGAAIFTGGASLAALGADAAMTEGAAWGAGLEVGADGALASIPSAAADVGGDLAAGASQVATPQFSFSDALKSAFSPSNIATSAAKSIATSAITGQPVSPEGIATGVVSGGVGNVAGNAAGGGLIGSVAGSTAAAGTSMAINGTPETPTVTPQAMAAATPGVPPAPGSNSVPTSFSTVLSSFQPKFLRS